MHLKEDQTLLPVKFEHLSLPYATAPLEQDTSTIFPTVVADSLEPQATLTS